MKDIFEKVYRKENLTEGEATTIARGIFSGSLTESQVAALLIGLKMKQVTSQEMAAFARVIQETSGKITQVPHNAMDNCGTGGDHLNSFNVSTTSAFVLAAGGIPMAKHGNRSISSRSGSADVLESLGVNITAQKEEIIASLNEIGIAFLFAQTMHPAMKFVRLVRADLATPTIFNLIGPLTNPVQLKTQLVGMYDERLLYETAETLGKLGRQRAIVLHGAFGMDEANLAGKTNYVLYNQGEITAHTLTPEEVGLKPSSIQEIAGGDAKRNGEILCSVLENKPSAYLDTVLLNAGLAFFANGQVRSVKEGIERAKIIVASGAARDKLQQLIARNE